MNQVVRRSTRHVGPFYFLAVLHPPPTPELRQALGDWAFTLNELQKLAPEVGQNLPIMVEHAGIQEAVDSTTDTNGQLGDRNLILAKLHDLGESDATRSVVGYTLSSEVVYPSGALYVIFQINEGLSGVASLVRNGYLTGVSLTTAETETSFRPIEVSLTKEPARPHCYIVFHSESLDKVRQYMSRLHNGGIRDRSSTLSRPYRIMAANAEAMQTDSAAAAPAAPDAAPKEKPRGELVMAAIEKIPDPEGRKLIMASLSELSARLEKDQEEAAKSIADAEARVKKAEEERDRAARLGRVNTTMMEQSLRALRSQLPEDVPFDDELAVRGITSEDPVEIQRAYSQVLMCASMASFANARKRASEKQATRESTEEDETIATMNALNRAFAPKVPLKSASAESKAAAAAADSAPAEVDAATVARMKVAAALNAFKPLE